MAFKELRFFGRRKGKSLNNSRQRLLDEMLPKLKPVLPAEGQTIDFDTFFGIKPKEVWLEVGFGGGEHVAELAKMYPDIGILGAEPFVNGVVSLLAHLNGSHGGESLTAGLEQGRTDNVRIWPDDVRQMFPYIKDGIFERVFVLYPDPWPKARHAERRFINQANLHHLHRLMSHTAHLYVATDVEAYAQWAVEQVTLSGLFEQVNKDISLPPVDWVPTRYEKKGIAAGRAPTYLVFRKKNEKNENNA